MVGDSAVPLLPKLRPELVFLRGEGRVQSALLVHDAARRGPQPPLRRVM